MAKFTVAPFYAKGHVAELSWKCTFKVERVEDLLHFNPFPIAPLPFSTHPRVCNNHQCTVYIDAKVHHKQLNNFAIQYNSMKKFATYDNTKIL